MTIEQVFDVFSKYLDLEGLTKNTRKSYFADVRSYLAWLKSTSKLDNVDDILLLLSHANQKNVAAYRDNLGLKGIKANHINRKLASLRKFFSFAKEQEWIKNNPAKKVANITTRNIKREPSDDLLIELTENMIIDKYHQQLKKEGLSSATVINYLSDARQFLQWLTKNQQN